MCQTKSMFWHLWYQFSICFSYFFHWMMLENVRKPTWCSLHISKLLDLSHVPGILACGMTWGSFLAVWHYGITSYFPKDDPINFPFFSPLDNVENPKFPKCVHKISGWLWIKTLLKKIGKRGTVWSCKWACHTPCMSFSAGCRQD